MECRQRIQDCVSRDLPAPNAVPQPAETPCAPSVEQEAPKRRLTVKITLTPDAPMQEETASRKRVAEVPGVELQEEQDQQREMRDEQGDTINIDALTA